MSKRTWKQRLTLTVPIFAAFAAPFIVAPSANAMPLSPATAVGCAGYWDITQIDILQPDNWVMKLKQPQKGADGSVIWGDADSGNGSDHQYGLVQPGGVVNGNHIDFNVGWRNGAIGHYWGDIDASGSAHGWAESGGRGIDWRLATYAHCMKLDTADPVGAPSPPALDPGPRPHHKKHHYSSAYRFLKLINNARAHPEQYPPHGNTQGATMTPCPNGLQHSVDLSVTAANHNDYVATQPIEWVNKDGEQNMHRDPNGELVWKDGEPMDKAGYKGWRSEIVATSQPTTEDALRFWMQDDEKYNWEHRNNILDCEHNHEAGANIHNGGPGGHYYTVDMGKR
jgi:hypothetical protein